MGAVNHPAHPGQLQGLRLDPLGVVALLSDGGGSAMEGRASARGTVDAVALPGELTS